MENILTQTTYQISDRLITRGIFVFGVLVLVNCLETLFYFRVSPSMHWLKDGLAALFILVELMRTAADINAWRSSK